MSYDTFGSTIVLVANLMGLLYSRLCCTSIRYVLVFLCDVKGDGVRRCNGLLLDSTGPIVIYGVLGDYYGD